KTSLTGGAGASTFLFANGATLSGGSIQGRSGSDMLDLEPYGAATRIDLMAGMAMNMATHTMIASLAGVNAAQGGQAGNTILGGVGNFVLIGGTGTDSVTAGTGTNVLYGGPDQAGSVDTLNGASGFTFFIFNSSADLSN